MLTGRFSNELISGATSRAGSWSPFPPAAERAAWEGLLRHPLNVRRMEDVLARSSELLGREIPVLPVRGFSEVVRSGERKTYESAYFSRRRDMASLVLSTCFSPDPARLEAALDFAWAICEETSWALPAHIDRRSPNDIMPEIRRPTLDIFSCETAAVLAETVHLLREELGGLSPVIAERIEGEIVRRIIEPFEQRDDFWWLAGENNWNPWCVSATLFAAAHVIRDPERLEGIIRRCMAALDRFIARYPEDGCCDEGAMYWAASPGALLVALEVLYSLSDGRISIYDEPKISAMAQYIGHVHLGGGHSFNYGDCPPRLGAVSGRAYRFGERVGDESLKGFALLARQGWRPGGEPVSTLGNIPGGGGCGSLLQALRELFWVPAEAVSQSPSVPLGHWYPEMEVLVARSAAEPAPAIVLGAKGGTNGVSHNHNDIGSFVINSSGSPVIVDVGNGAYTRQTFGCERYAMWWNASRGHNVLQFGDHEQLQGADFHAELIDVDESEASVRLVFELAGAYPSEAGVESWRRSCFLRRGESPSVTLTDSFRLRRPMKVQFPLFTPCSFDVGEGKAVFKISEGCGVAMTWDPRALQVTPVPLESDEPIFQEAWGGGLRKLLCRIPGEVAQAEYQLSFEPCRLGKPNGFREPLAT
ncbi:MAG: heparinase II/III family protein [Verrucomicrobiae bacterium]